VSDVPTEVEPAAGALSATGSGSVAPSAPATLVALAASVEMTDVDSSQAAHADIAPGTGRLRDLAGWLAGIQGRWPALAPTRPRLVSRGPVSAAAAAVADSIGVGIDVVETGPTEVAAAFAFGIAAADVQVDAGTDVIVVADGADSIAGAALVSIVTDAEPVALLPRGADAIDTEGWIERAARLRDLRRTVRAHRHDPDELLAALGDPALATTCGFVIRAVERRTAVVLDGTNAVAAAVLCHRTRERVGRWLRVADTSPDPVHSRAVGYLDQRPVLDLDTRHGDGLAGLLVISMLRAAAELGRPVETEGHE
jgi:NaMN:DMB phosphoribosyltransferase